MYWPDHGDVDRDFGKGFDLPRPRFIGHNSDIGGSESDSYDGSGSAFVAANVESAEDILLSQRSQREGPMERAYSER